LFAALGGTAIAAAVAATATSAALLFTLALAGQ
jgi:hypothetical protein